MIENQEYKAVMKDIAQWRAEEESRGRRRLLGLAAFALVMMGVVFRWAS